MTQLKGFLSKLTPPVVASIAIAALAAVAAFGVTLSVPEQASVVIFVGAGSLILLKLPTVESIVGLITAGIAVAVAFGLPVTGAQSESIVILTGAIAALVLGKGTVTAVIAHKETSPPAPPLSREAKASLLTSNETRANLGLQRVKYKGGRLPAFRPPGLKTFLEYTSKLVKPPSIFKAPAGPYPIDGNATYGDCTVAGVAHLIAAWNRLFGKKDRVPSEGTIDKTYFHLTGGQDTGLVEANVLAVWRKIGLFGHKIWGYAPVKTTDANAIKQAIAFYGGCYLGIQCPESAQRQFANGEPWTDEGETTEDGHCIVALGFDAKGNLECASWGEIVIVTPGFLKAYLDEAWVIISHQLVEAGGDTLGLKTAELEADLASV